MVRFTHANGVPKASRADLLLRYQTQLLHPVGPRRGDAGFPHSSRARVDTELSGCAAYRLYEVGRDVKLRLGGPFLGVTVRF